MDEELIGSTVLAKGLNFQEALNSSTEFHIDVNFKLKKNRNDLLLLDSQEIDDLLNDDDDDDESDTGVEKVLKDIEKSTDSHLLATLDYSSFDQLATRMTDCVTSGKVKMLIIEEGDGPLISYDAYVTLHYSAYWENEKIPFDSTFTKRNGAPLTKRLGYDSLLLGLQIGLPFVHGPTATVHFLLHPDYMWKNGYFPGIRNERALYSITVVKVKDLAAVERFNELPSTEQKKFETTVKVVNSSNLHAKDLFNKKLFTKAASHYHKSLSVLQVSCPETEQEKAEVLKLICKVYLNLATVYYKLNLPKNIILMCDDLCKVTDINTNCKALYYYGKAFYLLADYDQAKKFYLRALKLEPKNSDIGRAMADLDNAIKKGKNQEQDLWKNAFKNKKIEKVQLDVDEEFQNNFIATCQDLNTRNGFAKFVLPDGLNKNEVEYIKDLVKGFDKLLFNEDIEGKSKKYVIIKKLN